MFALFVANINGEIYAEYLAQYRRNNFYPHIMYKQSDFYTEQRI